MDQFSELRSLGQIDSSEAGRVFREFLRGQVRQSLVNIMAEEVRRVVRAEISPRPDADCHRAGTAPRASCLCEGRRERIARPRVRRTKQRRFERGGASWKRTPRLKSRASWTTCSFARSSPAPAVAR